MIKERFKSSLGIFAIVCVVFILLMPFAIDNNTRLTWLNDLQAMTGIKAVLALSLLYVLSNLLFIPIGMPLNLLAGMLWGTFFGGILINSLATLVAAIAFLIARNFEEVLLKHKIFNSTLLSRVTSVIRSHDWQFIAMARINPIIPFCVSNYVFGLIPQLSFRHYIIATILANLLPCFVFASIGAAFKTFTLENNDIHHIVFSVGIVLLFVSLLFTIKIFTNKKADAFK